MHPPGENPQLTRANNSPASHEQRASDVGAPFCRHSFLSQPAASKAQYGNPFPPCFRLISTPWPRWQCSSLGLQRDDFIVRTEKQCEALSTVQQPVAWSTAWLPSYYTCRAFRNSASGRGRDSSRWYNSKHHRNCCTLSASSGLK